MWAAVLCKCTYMYMQHAKFEGGGKTAVWGRKIPPLPGPTCTLYVEIAGTMS